MKSIWRLGKTEEYDVRVNLVFAAEKLWSVEILMKKKTIFSGWVKFPATYFGPSGLFHLILGRLCISVKILNKSFP